MALAPRLTALDRRVLAVLSTDYGLRGLRVAELVHGVRHWNCGECGRIVVCQEHFNRAWNAGRMIGCRACWDAERAEASEGWRERRLTMRPVLIVTAELEREVAEVLRGLQRTGHAVQSGGWWRQSIGTVN